MNRSARVRELLALCLAALVLVSAVGAFAQSRMPDEVDRITERVMVRLGTGVAPPAASGGSTPAADPSCVPETVVDEYGFEVPITDCE